MLLKIVGISKLTHISDDAAAYIYNANKALGLYLFNDTDTPCIYSSSSGAQPFSESDDDDCLAPKNSLPALTNTNYTRDNIYPLSKKRAARIMSLSCHDDDDDDESRKCKKKNAINSRNTRRGCRAVCYIV